MGQGAGRCAHPLYREALLCRGLRHLPRSGTHRQRRPEPQPRSNANVGDPVGGYRLRERFRRRRVGAAQPMEDSLRMGRGRMGSGYRQAAQPERALPGGTGRLACRCLLHDLRLGGERLAQRGHTLAPRDACAGLHRHHLRWHVRLRAGRMATARGSFLDSHGPLRPIRAAGSQSARRRARGL